MSDPRTWLTIEGERYDMHRAIRQPAIRDLIDLKRATQVGGEGGIAIKTIADTMQALGALFEDASTPEEQQAATLSFFDSIETLQVFAALVFLAKRKAGEPISFDEATGYSVFDIGFDVEDSEEQADPKEDSRTLEDPADVPTT